MNLFDEFDIRSLFMVDAGRGRLFKGESSKIKTDQKTRQYYGKTKVHNNGVNNLEVAVVGRSKEEVISRLTEMTLFVLEDFIFALNNARIFPIDTDLSCNLN